MQKNAGMTVTSRQRSFGKNCTPATVLLLCLLILRVATPSQLFGDLSYYWIADREGRSFKRLNELFAATGQVGFLASERVDGKLVLSEAVKVLKQA